MGAIREDVIFNKNFKLFKQLMGEKLLYSKNN